MGMADIAEIPVQPVEHRGRGIGNLKGSGSRDDPDNLRQTFLDQERAAQVPEPGRPEEYRPHEASTLRARDSTTSSASRSVIPA